MALDLNTIEADAKAPSKVDDSNISNLGELSHLVGESYLDRLYWKDGQIPQRMLNPVRVSQSEIAAQNPLNGCIIFLQGGCGCCQCCGIHGYVQITCRFVDQESAIRRSNTGSPYKIQNNTYTRFFQKDNVQVASAPL